MIKYHSDMMMRSLDLSDILGLGGEHVHYDPSSLIVAVSKACGHFPDVDMFSDCLTMQKGCYILNSWGYEPVYEYGMYIRGPYSKELADDCYEMHGKISGDTDVSESDLSRLKELYAKGLPYVEAYVTVLLLKNSNPNVASNKILDRVLELKPHLEKEVREAYTSLQV